MCKENIGDLIAFNLKFDTTSVDRVFVGDGTQNIPAINEIILSVNIRAGILVQGPGV